MVFFICGIGLGIVCGICIVGLGKVFCFGWSVSEIVVWEFVYYKFCLVI